MIFISQRFHLPRIAQQCAGFQLDAQFLVADRDRPLQARTAVQTLVIRFWRHSREALLIWSEILGLYRTLSAWKETRGG